jgi:hypothetical protein
MATIIDPDFLFDNADDSVGASIYIDTALRTIKIRNNSAAPKGPVLDETGVTLQALYSFLKEEWKNDPNIKSLIAYPFPLIAITPEQFEFRYGWTPADDSSRSLIRTAGWREFGTDNTTLKREYMGTISLGSIDGDQNQDGGGDQDFVYYAFFDSASGIPKTGAITYNFPGEVNQAVQTLDSTAFDRRGDILRLFIRQPLKTYDQTDTTDIGLSAGTTLPYNTQRFPLVEGQDLKLLAANGGVTDATIAANTAGGQKYSMQGDGPTIEYLETSELSNTFGYAEDLLDGPHNFGIKIASIDGTDGTSPLSNQELYSFVQYQLRQDSDIEVPGATQTSTKIGKLSDELLAYVGDTLTTKLATNIDQGGAQTGVAITNIRPADINITQLTDDAGVLQSFPFSTAITISFSQDILNDGANAKAFVYYDYTRGYTGTEFQLANVGTAASDATQDSANFILTGFSTTPVLSTQNPNGLNPAVPADAYFKVHKNAGTGANHNVIWKVTTIYDSSNFAAITLDDTVLPINETLSTAGDAIRTHPMNSPSALLVDSASAPSENGGGVVSTLAAGNLNASSQLSFTYAYDGNTQKDRLASSNVAINVRALGLENGTWVEQTATVARVNENTVSVVSAVERNYSNP